MSHFESAQNLHLCKFSTKWTHLFYVISYILIHITIETINLIYFKNKYMICNYYFSVIMQLALLVCICFSLSLSLSLSLVLYMWERQMHIFIDHRDAWINWVWDCFCIIILTSLSQNTFYSELCFPPCHSFAIFSFAYSWFGLWYEWPKWKSDLEADPTLDPALLLVFKMEEYMSFQREKEL